MKYIRSDEYTYDEMRADTQVILDKYDCELDDIQLFNTMGVAKFHSNRYKFYAECIIDYRDGSAACCITDIKYRLWDIDMDNIAHQLRDIREDITDAME